MFQSQQVGCMNSSERSVDLFRVNDEHVASFDLYLDLHSPHFLSCEDETAKNVRQPDLVEERESHDHVFLSESFDVLRRHRNRQRKLNVRSLTTLQPFHVAEGPTLPTETIIKLAAEKFIGSSNHLYPSSASSQSEEESRGVRLVQNLMHCAEKVAESQYERAVKFLNECNRWSSCTGTPVQRLVYYFSEALLQKIAVETGRIMPKDSEQKILDPMEMMMFPNLNLQVAFHNEYPISQISKLVSVQAVLDHVKQASKVHIIDLEIRSGVHWIALMQSLAARLDHPVEHLKITAIMVKETSTINETSKQLSSYAESLNIKFTFKTVLVDDVLDLNHTLFDLSPDESVSVYAAYALMSMVGRVDRLNHLMTVVKNINPCVMVVTELEVNCNSPTFIGRFVESLFFFGTFFDSLADCFKNDESNRMTVESTWFRSSIRNVLTTEGEQRKIRHVNINVWRAFFDRLGLVETDLSTLSLDQASLMLQSYPCGSSCTLYMDGKCLTLGWKGSPISSLSAWKFQ